MDGRRTLSIFAQEATIRRPSRLSSTITSFNDHHDSEIEGLNDLTAFNFQRRRSSRVS
jgi:hypothetical protein